MSRTRLRPLALLGAAAVTAAMSAPVVAAGTSTVVGAAAAILPAVSDYAQVSASSTPPTEAQCEAVGRLCFSPQATQSAYHLGPLYADGVDGRGMTIAVVDSYGSDTMAHDLAVYNTAFGLPHLCGEEGQPSVAACPAGRAWFNTLHVQGSPATKAPPSQSKGTGQESKAAWALEVALDVETAHAMAPAANILLVATPTAETLGVQGLSQMMNAEQYVIDHRLAQVISQSFGTAEGAFGSAQSIEQLRHAFKSAPAAGVTILASSGDDGSTGYKKTPVHSGGTELAGYSVGWPASDPLVTSVGGTYLCTNPYAATNDPRTNYGVRKSGCAKDPTQEEIGWTFSGGGFSSVFGRPDYQSAFAATPTGQLSTPFTSMRGVPDVALQASAGTGALVYLTLPPDGNSGLICGTAPCSTGWYDIGGTSLSSPQYAGIVALAGQYAKRSYGVNGLGFINDDLYGLAGSPTTYAAAFHDVTVGNNDVHAIEDGTAPSHYFTHAGWDPVTGLGTPDASVLVPALAQRATGH